MWRFVRGFGRASKRVFGHMRRQRPIVIIIEIIIGLMLIEWLLTSGTGFVEQWIVATATVVIGMYFARRRWPRVLLRSYLRARKVVLPALLMIVGIGAQVVIDGIGLGAAPASGFEMLIAGLLAASALSVVISIFEGKAMRETFEHVPVVQAHVFAAGGGARTLTYRARPPAMTFDKLYGYEDTKARLRDALKAWREEGKNGVLFDGPPGTGKTVLADAVAAEAGVGIIKVNFGDVASKWINATTEQVKKLIAEARAQAPVVLFLDEVDALLGDRSSGFSSNSERGATTSTLMNDIQDLHGTGVLVIAATNYYDNLDAAAKRVGRFDFHITVPLPDADARKGLIEARLAAMRCSMEPETLARLVTRWGGFNVPRILACTDGACKAARAAAGRTEKPVKKEAGDLLPVKFSDCYQALRIVQGKHAGAPEGAKSLAEMFLNPEQKRQLEDLVTHMRDVDEYERRGSTMPRGVLFDGPPGTGKTATAMALARDSGWTFLSCTGQQLLDRNELARVRKQASDLRPAIVFIDEGDDILGDRQFSMHKEGTNAVLTMIDGADGMLHDVVWIAATNHPEAIDSAALRGGRFGLKVHFTIPTENVTREIVADWTHRHLEAKSLQVAGGTAAWVEAVTQIVKGRAPADVYQVLETANNYAIADAVRTHDQNQEVDMTHIRRAIEALAGRSAQYARVGDVFSNRGEGE